MDFAKKLAMAGMANLVIGTLIGVWGDLLKFNYEIPMAAFMTLGILLIVGGLGIVFSEL